MSWQPTRANEGLCHKWARMASGLCLNQKLSALMMARCQDSRIDSPLKETCFGCVQVVWCFGWSADCVAELPSSQPRSKHADLKLRFFVDGDSHVSAETCRSFPQTPKNRRSHIQILCKWDPQILGLLGGDPHVSTETRRSPSTQKRSSRSPWIEVVALVEPEWGGTAGLHRSLAGKVLVEACLGSCL